MWRPRIAARLALALLALGPVALAEPADGDVEMAPIRPPEPVPEEGRPVRRIEVRSTFPRWEVTPPRSFGVATGEAFSPGIGRRAARELTESGGVADVRVEVEPEGDGVVVRLVATPLRVVQSVRVQSDLEVEDVLQRVGVATGRAVTPAVLRAAELALLARAEARGYPQARALVSYLSTDNPLVVVLQVELSIGTPRRIAGVRTEVQATSMPDRLREVLGAYGVRAGQRVDEEAITEQDRQLLNRLQSRGFHQAHVEHRLYGAGRDPFLLLTVRPGPMIRARFEGNLWLDAEQLDDTLDFEHDPERGAARGVQRIREEYLRQGFLDVEVTAQERGGPDEPLHDLAFMIRENARVRVASRQYPCLPPPGPSDVVRKVGDLNSEIDSFLEEELPGVTLLGAVDPGVIDRTLGPHGTTGARPAPPVLDPHQVYVADVYDRAVKHLRDVYRSEGYLAAVVGPVQVVRHRCSPASPPNQCIPMALPAVVDRCAVDIHQVPVDEPALPPEMTCRPDPRKGIVCAPDMEVRIPVKPGPRAIVHDVVFENAQAFAETELLRLSGLKPGEWASNVKIEDARRALLDHYKEEGYAYAEVSVATELSPDKKLARVRFTLLERQPVTIERIRIVGNARTEESVVRARLRLKEGSVYRQSSVRRSEEQLATLGVFSTVTIGLEDAAVPARHKNVIISVAERAPQYLEVRPGLSTGEGIRGVLEYGHRNLGGLAIQLTMRVQLSYLPSEFIPDPRVQSNFDKLSLGERLERRNSISVQFPNVFLPTVRLGIDAVDVRSNGRDFGITKDALLPSLTWSARRQLSVTLGASVELNNVSIFSGDTVENYLKQQGVNNDLSRLLRVPDGETTAIAQRLSAVWDRRDNPLGATKGTLLAGSVEHVNAFPAENNPNTITSEFLRLNGRAGVYFPLTKRGLTLAAIIGAGYNYQLRTNSKTYPDRLFFLGGIDSMRGFLRDSLVPQDIADRIAADRSKPDTDTTKFTISQVAIRGGDVFINPRLELRIPLFNIVETALFVDSGNLWVEPRLFEPWNLRVTGGSGLRFTTPIGPIAFDYGINLRRRSWEDFGAFHFSIGLF